MKVDATKVINGMVNYADHEVINSLPIAGKWIMGTGIGIVTTKVNDIINAMNDNAIIKAMGIVDDDGMYDIDLIADKLKESASRYGKMTIQVPLVGRLTFSETDVDALKEYIERESY